MWVNAMKLEDFHEMVVSHLVNEIPQYADRLKSLKASDDLLASGALDSHRFVELCLFIEEKAGAPIDIAEADPEQLSTIEGLYSIVTQG
jgi:acyl carrier protein